MPKFKSYACFINTHTLCNNKFCNCECHQKAQPPFPLSKHPNPPKKCKCGRGFVVMYVHQQPHRFCKECLLYPITCYCKPLSKREV